MEWNQDKTKLKFHFLQHFAGVLSWKELWRWPKPKPYFIEETTENKTKKNWLFKQGHTNNGKAKLIYLFMFLGIMFEVMNVLFRKPTLCIHQIHLISWSYLEKVCFQTFLACNACAQNIFLWFQRLPKGYDGSQIRPTDNTVTWNASSKLFQIHNQQWCHLSSPISACPSLYKTLGTWTFVSI